VNGETPEIWKTKGMDTNIGENPGYQSLENSKKRVWKLTQRGSEETLDTYTGVEPME